MLIPTAVFSLFSLFSCHLAVRAAGICDAFIFWHYLSYTPRGPLSLIVLLARSAVACHAAALRCTRPMLTPDELQSKTRRNWGDVRTQTPEKSSPEGTRVWGCSYTHSKASWRLPMQAHFTRHTVNQRTRENTQLDVRPNTYVCPAKAPSECPRKPTQKFTSHYFKFNCHPQTNVSQYATGF